MISKTLTPNRRARPACRWPGLRWVDWQYRTRASPGLTNGAGTRHVVSDLNASSAELRYGEPVAVRSGFRARSEQPPLSAEVELEGVINYAVGASRYTIAPLAARAVIEGEDVRAA